jgi:hypothetical protein
MFIIGDKISYMYLFCAKITENLFMNGEYVSILSLLIKATSGIFPNAPIDSIVLRI